MVVIDFQALADLQKAMRGQYEEIETLLTSLSEQVSTVWESYEGKAAEGMRRSVDQWFTAARDLHNQLGELHNLVATTHDNHAAAVHTGVRRWQVWR